MEENNNQMDNKNKLITIGLSAVLPGAGHMYLGLINKGIILMGAYLVLNWIDLGILRALRPILWFYGIFDSLETLKGNRSLDSLDKVDFNNFSLDSLNYKYLGYGLIGMGVLIILDKLFKPLIVEFLGYKFISFMEVTLIASIFILGGIKLISMNKSDEDDEY